MDSIARAAGIYLCVWLVVRFAGKRTMAEITTFDFILLLIIGEATQQALLGNDFSLVNAVTVVVTLVAIDVVLSYVKGWFPALDRALDGTPVIILKDGEPLKDRLKRVRVGEDDIMEAARRLQGLERMDQIKYAVLEQSGGITIIPKER